ncbi:MAG: 3-oxoacyl-ACP synthase [Cyclobacteriaceae bacterium]|nr:3-oxoacyl-ACP synthase [Cyclobacteriaceae bacterium]
MKELKYALHQHCIEYVNKRIEAVKQAMQMAQEAADEETKSSSGDKYETGRSMMQLEIQKYEVQLSEALKLRHVVNNIRPNFTYDDVQEGSLVRTTQGLFYISISAGKIKVGNDECFAVSAASPIGQAMIGLKKGNSYNLNGKNFEILEIN